MLKSVFLYCLNCFFEYAFIFNLCCNTDIRCISLKKTTLALTISFLILASMIVMQSSCQVVAIQEGRTISYSYVRTFSSDGTIQVGDADYIIESFNETSLGFTIIGRTTVNFGGTQGRFIECD